MLFTPMTRKAMIMAYNAHHGQTDKSGVPYIFHPARVAAGFNDEAEACVAWLHDIVEDTDCTVDDIRLAGFGETICDAIKTMTHDKRIPYADYVKGIANNPIARAVKLADLQDNMDTSRMLELDEKAERRLAKYHAAYAYLTGNQNAFDSDDTYEKVGAYTPEYALDISMRLARKRMDRLGWEEPLTEEQKHDLMYLPDDPFMRKYKVRF